MHAVTHIKDTGYGKDTQTNWKYLSYFISTLYVQGEIFACLAPNVFSSSKSYLSRLEYLTHAQQCQLFSTHQAKSGKKSFNLKLSIAIKNKPLI